MDADSNQPPSPSRTLDMATEAPIKRCGESEADDEAVPSRMTSTTWTRHPELWLERSDIVLVCRDIGFCVGQCILFLNSPVFREMFRTVDPTQSEMFEGLSVVELHDDPEEIYHSLKALHFRQYARRKSEPTFEVLAAVLKLSTKYIIEDLREEFIEMLVEIFPSTLSSIADQDGRYIPDDLDTLYAVELAKQYDVPIILPIACYMSSLFPVKDIMDPSTSSASTATRCTCAIFRDELMNTGDAALTNGHKADMLLFTADQRDSKGNWKCSEDNCCSVTAAWVETTELRMRRLVEKDLFSPSLGRLDTCNTGCEVIKKRMDEHWAGIQREIWDALLSLCGYEDRAAVQAAQNSLTGDEVQAYSPSEEDDTDRASGWRS